MEEPMGMAHLAWIASEPGSGAGLPNETIILQKLHPAPIQSVGRDPV
jgi:hypothetical protein